MMHQLHFLVLASSCSIALSAAAVANGVTERVSIGTGGIEGNAGSVTTQGITPDGRFVAFGSEATNLVANDTNGVNDMFVRDRRTGTTERVSLGNDRIQANDFSGGDSISASGRLSAFLSGATNLVPGGPTEFWQAYVFDRQSGRTRRVSVGPRGVPANDALVGPIFISGNGRHVVFTSSATNLVPNDTNGGSDVFVRDISAGLTERVSIGVAGAQCGGSSNGISADGRFVLLTTSCTRMVLGGSNGENHAFVRDRKTGRNDLVSVRSNGVEGNGFSVATAITPDGRFAGFVSSATNLVSGDTNGQTDVFVHDRKTGKTERVSVDSRGVQSNGFSSGGEMSADGRYVAFSSEATNLVPDDTNGVSDIFVHDRKTGKTRRVSVGPKGLQSNGGSLFQALTASGRAVVFTSDASNLVPGDTNGVADVFVHSW